MQTHEIDARQIIDRAKGSSRARQPNQELSDALSRTPRNHSFVEGARFHPVGRAAESVRHGLQPIVRPDKVQEVNFDFSMKVKSILI